VYAGQVENVYGRQVLHGTTTGAGGVYAGGGEGQVVCSTDVSFLNREPR
jgi:hypothetical protein